MIIRLADDEVRPATLIIELDEGQLANPNLVWLLNIRHEEQTKAPVRGSFIYVSRHHHELFFEVQGGFPTSKALSYLWWGGFVAHLSMLLKEHGFEVNDIQYTTHEGETFTRPRNREFLRVAAVADHR